MSSQTESIGLQTWNDFNKAVGENLGKVQALLTDAYVLFDRAVRAYDAGIAEGTVLLCRAALESAFMQFVSTQWNDEGSFTIVYPTTLDGKPRRVEFEELRSAIKQKVAFSEKQLKAIDRIQQNGNFVAHMASHKIKQHFTLGEKFREFQAANKNLTDGESAMAVVSIARSVLFLITSKQALDDLQDTSSIMVTLGMAFGKAKATAERQDS